MMVLYSPDWTNTGFSFILLTVNLFRHSTLTEQGLYILFYHLNLISNIGYSILVELLDTLKLPIIGSIVFLTH